MDEKFLSGGKRLHQDRVQNSQNPLVSVITVVLNGALEIEKTISSVLEQEYDNVEYIIIDGCSTDGTLEIIEKYSDKIDYWISCKDNGIYDAMNLGIRCASGVWINFMNCGDTFFSTSSLDNFLHDTSIDLYYSDTVFCGGGFKKKVECSWSKRRFIHQSIIYKRNLHDNCSYLVHKNFTISDYIFFLENINKKWKKIDSPIALYNCLGVSSKPSHFYQKLFIDFLHGYLTRTQFALIVLLYPIYRAIKSFKL